MNRNHYFILGFVAVLLGLQFRMVESVVLNEKASNFMADKLGQSPIDEGNPFRALIPGGNSMVPKQTITPPNWLGWCLLSAGGILVMHSFTMPKPG